MSFRVFDSLKFKQKIEPLKYSYIVERSGGKIHRMSVSGWANGKATPRADSIALLLDILNCDFDEISSPYEEVKNRDIALQA